MGKAFEKQIETIEDQGQKQFKALEDLKLKEQAKPTIFNDFINKRKEIMSELYGSVDHNNLKLEYIGLTKDVSFYEHMDSNEPFKATKNQIKFSEVKNEQNDFLNKLNNIKNGKRTTEQKETIRNLENFYNSREEVINFFRGNIEMLSDAKYDAKQD